MRSKKEAEKQRSTNADKQLSKEKSEAKRRKVEKQRSGEAEKQRS